jgi:hypothetical protein
VNRGTASDALQRALEISRELAAVADHGDVQLTQRLDAARLQLLQSVKAASPSLSDIDLANLREIAELNVKAIGLLEHRRRSMARDLDMLVAGKRAVRAYSATGRHRWG